MPDTSSTRGGSSEDGQEQGRQARDELENRYELCEKLGEGTYGKVYRGMDKVTREPVAIKRMKINLEDEGCPSLAIREIALLRKIKSANVVSLLHIHVDRCSSSPWDSLTLVFELLTYDLRQFIKMNSIPSAPCLKYFIYQILRGVKACHDLRIMHRDIKPQNLLISQTTGRIKLADFGLARSYMHPTHRCTHEIVTLWYRAPEVIMGSLEYTYSIDVWSIGCVMAELFTGGSPLFPTDSEVETLFRIFRMLGTPTPETWPGIVETCPDYCELWPKWKEDRGLQTMQQRNSEIPDWLNELALSCLRVTPTARASVAGLMAHPWFKDVDDAWVAGEFFVCPGLHSDSQPIKDEAEPL
ncbi:CDK1, putative [Perkinsus marinus ATCC 50983]|uniref:Cyclin-dependent kinase 2 homolog n=1 Tax=Perkinsus marinus (strain ATCC 50983 / TXsc) TaxID=423536 RepID=C5L0A2_PERM5|nr:CDK1, putative [Perkinsus marinus ATCC 50983]EER09960.1 CDK1, putative [Perkinsus marinus ATCC 50983]|eukprot:XP_002778165.1 CDK1, putative [Perkinsus marinus ATCC 50983]